MKKKLVLGLLVVTMVVLPLFSACAEEKLTEVIELRLATHEPAISPTMTACAEWADKIEEETDGMVKITFFYSETLLSSADMIAGVKAGTADIGHIAVDNYPDYYPLNCILSLPFMPLGDWRSLNDIWAELLDEFPEMNAEWDEFKVLYRYAVTGQQIHTTDTPVRVPEDLEGVRIWAVGETQKALNAVGASAMFIPPPDWYTSLDRGLLDGMAVTWDAVYEMGLYELLFNHTIFPSYVAHPTAQFIMNLDTWNSLPSYVQDIIDDLAPWIQERVGELLEEKIDGYIDAIEEVGGHTFITLTRDDEQVWLDGAVAIQNEYIDELEAQGLPARDIYEEALRLAQQ